MHRLDAVPRGPHVREVRLEVLVYLDRVGRSDLCPRFLGECYLGLRADCDHHELCFDLLVRESHGPDAPLVVAHERLDLSVGEDADPILLELFSDLFGDLGAVDAADPLHGFVEGDFHPELDKVLGHLEPYVTSPDDGRLFRRALLYKAAYFVRVGEEAQAEDAVEVRAVDGEEYGTGARGDDEAVVGIYELLAGREVPDEELFLLRIHLLDAMADEDLDVFFGELLGGTGDEVVPVPDDAGDQIRQPALTLRDLRLLLVNGYLEIGVDPPGPGSRLRASGHSPYYHQTHSHVFPSTPKTSLIYSVPLEGFFFHAETIQQEALADVLWVFGSVKGRYVRTRRSLTVDTLLPGQPGYSSDKSRELPPVREEIANRVVGCRSVLCHRRSSPICHPPKP